MGCQRHHRHEGGSSTAGPQQTRIRGEPEAPFEMPAMRPARGEEAPRRAHVMKRHCEKHGYTEGCEGCGRLSAGMKPRPHSNACRERMYKELKATEEGRKWIEESEARIGDYLESKIRDEHGDRDHEVEEKQKEGLVASPAIPASPLASGATTMDVPKPTALKTDGDITKPEKKG